MAEEMIRGLHGGQSVPTSSKPPLPRRDEDLKFIAGTIMSYVKAWPDEAIKFLADEILAVMDSIEVYAQEHFGPVECPEVLPRIALSKQVGLMRLHRTFAAQISPLDQGEQERLLRAIGRPGEMQELANAEEMCEANENTPDPKREVRKQRTQLRKVAATTTTNNGWTKPLRGRLADRSSLVVRPTARQA
ncbi:MAG: hypothetical protein DRR04_13480 [Gammaproteobacteria bacterium]|nr:MAG: hypothetical protein DRR04_13480 [Gammaproteobacteria bacterium]